MRKPIVLILAVLVLLFPPYWDSGIFTDDFGWVFLFDNYSWSTPVLSMRFFLGDFSLLVFLLEIGALLAVNAVWKRGEPAPLPGQAMPAKAISASAPRSDAAEELAKLNRLRQDGVLSEEEFAVEKARLMAPSADTRAAASVAAGEFPTTRIATAVQLLRDAGLPESQIVMPANRWAWSRGKPLPPGPYIVGEPRYAAVLFGLAGVMYSLLMALFGFGGGFDTFLFAAVAFGGLMWIAFKFIADWIISKRGLPRWDDIPG